jgi:hypothetical protein
MIGNDRRRVSPEVGHFAFAAIGQGHDITAAAVSFFVFDGEIESHE